MSLIGRAAMPVVSQPAQLMNQRAAEASRRPVTRLAGSSTACGPATPSSTASATTTGNDHVGIVVAVDGSTMTTGEGNSSDRTARLSVARGGRDISGYARPRNR